MKRLLLVLCMFGSVFNTAKALAAGAYSVDDAAIVDPGKIQNESWYSHGAHGWDVGAANLAYQLLPDTEVTIQEAHTFRPDGSNLVSPQVKYAWYKQGANGISSSIVVGTNYAAFQNLDPSLYVYAPVSLMITKNLEADADLGWQYDAATDRHFMTWGFAEEYQITELLSMNSDVFGRTRQNPGFQLGPHFTITDSLSFDLIYGHNIFGSEENSGTAGMTLTF